VWREQEAELGVGKSAVLRDQASCKLDKKWEKKGSKFTNVIVNRRSQAHPFGGGNRVWKECEEEGKKEVERRIQQGRLSKPVQKDL